VRSKTAPEFHVIASGRATRGRKLGSPDTR
jgi:hypothetical protein